MSTCSKEKVSMVECYLKEKAKSASWNVIESAWYMSRGSISGTKVFEVPVGDYLFSIGVDNAQREYRISALY